VVLRILKINIIFEKINIYWKYSFVAAVPVAWILITKIELKKFW
jgi:hypothetical protein